MPQVLIDGLYCLRCSHRWVPRNGPPASCPKCRSPYWDRVIERPSVSIASKRRPAEVAP